LSFQKNPCQDKADLIDRERKGKIKDEKGKERGSMTRERTREGMGMEMNGADTV
jgi:hypothetical protein